MHKDFDDHERLKEYEEEYGKESEGGFELLGGHSLKHIMAARFVKRIGNCRGVGQSCYVDLELRVRLGLRTIEMAQRLASCSNRNPWESTREIRQT